MWWSSKQGLVVLAVAGLSACGFHPLYGTSSVDPQVGEELASIRILTISERQGQLVHNALLHQLNPLGEPAKPVYTLSVSVNANDGQEALLHDNTASRNRVTYVVIYRLSDGKAIVTQGTVTKQLSYDFLPQHYADISAQEDVARRAADVIAQEISTDLAAYFIRATEVKQGKLEQTR